MNKIILNARLFGLALISCLTFSTSVLADGNKIPSQGTWNVDLSARDFNGDLIADAYYDSALNITWLSSAGGNNASMTWAEATAWAATFSVGGETGWRLPRTVDFGNDGCNFGDANSGMGKDCGYRPAPSSSELAHLYYITLGNQGDTLGNHTKSWLENAGPFVHVQAQISNGLYWSETNAITDPNKAWVFATYDGWQNIVGKASNQLPVWVVHDGDIGISAVPESKIGLLMLFGLFFICVIRNRSLLAGKPIQ